LDYFFKILKRSIFFIALYGIFLFFYKIFTGSIFEIPFLTINYHDRGLLESIKSIDRGTFFKLISTYNNGNVYGICILMFLPLYNYLEKNKLKRSIVKLSFLLTLSRTVWIGLIISEFLYNFFIKKNKSLSFIKSTISICISIIIIIFLGKLMNIDISWFFDPTLGNRLNPEYFDIKLFSHIAFEHIEEMLYLSILHIFGVVGFIFFIIGFFSPIIIFTLKNYMKKIANINKVIFLGLINYFIISIADAAILYIPTIAIFWFLSTFLFTNKKVNSNFA
jgi:hypothetical protein